MGSKVDKQMQYMCKFGIYRPPVAWIRDACKLTHPFDQYHAVPDSMLEVIFWMLTSPPDSVVQYRAQCLKRWLSLASELESQEREHKKHLDHGVGAVLAGKRLLLLRRIAADMNWPDMELFNEIDRGFELVGLQEPSGIFDLEPRPQQIQKKICGMPLSL